MILLIAVVRYINSPPSRLSGSPTADTEYFIGEVLSVVNGKIEDRSGAKQPTQKVEIKLRSGEEKGKVIKIDQGETIPLRDNQLVDVSDKIIVAKTERPEGGGYIYYINDVYRLPAVGFIGLIFFVFAILFARLKGFKSILGLVFSILILVKFVIPQVAAGRDPLTVSLIGALIIAVISIYLAHGFNKRTSIALLSTVITLGLAAFLSIIFVSLSKLSGLSSEEAGYLEMDLNFLDFKGLLLGGIIIGVLGVLDDITTSQVAAVGEIHEANTRLNFSEVYKRGLSVGKEHIASLINTLALAYAGAAFPLLLLFSRDKNFPAWVNFNNEFIVEEVIRTLVGSTALIFAVPISTFFAAFFLIKKVKTGKNAGL